MLKVHNKSVNLATASSLLALVIGAAVSSGAYAQSASQSAAAPAADAQSSSANGNAISEITVTAQRRSENLQNVPISVTALTGKSLEAEGVRTPSDLTQVVPGLLFARSTNFLQPAIRGISTRAAAIGDEPNVATYLDGVYQPDALGTSYELANLESVQVLKGPQGSLYGRNATGGAILINTRGPTFDWTGNVAASYASFNYRKVSGMVSGPIIADKVAFSLSGVTYADDGYVHNLYLNTTDGKSKGTAVRVKTLFKPTEDLSFQINGLHTFASDNSLLSTYSLNGNSVVRTLVGNALVNPTGLPLSSLLATQPYTTTSAIDPVSKAKQDLVDAHFDWNMGWATLSGLVSFAHTGVVTDSMGEGSPLRLSETIYTTSSHNRNQELVLTSPSGKPVTWVVGVTGFQARDVLYLNSISHKTTTGLFSNTRIDMGQNTDSVAGFGEVTWEALHHLFLTGGVRYDWDKKSAFNQTTTNVGTSAQTALAQVNASSSFKSTTPRAVLRYEWAKDSNVYASFSEGFKSGGFNPSAASGVVTSTGQSAAVSPETVKAYEIGVKSQLGNHVRLNLAAFHYDYANLQVSASVIDPVSHASVVKTQNAATAKVNGVEANITAKLTNEFTLNASANVMKASFNQFPNASANVPITSTNTANCALGGVPTLNGNVACILSATGNDLIRSPRYTFNIGGTYKTKLAGGSLTLSADAFFSAKYFGDVANTVVQPAYSVVNASATWRTPNERAYVTVYGTNLTSQVYMVGVLPLSFDNSTQAAKPRVVGVTIGYDF